MQAERCEYGGKSGRREERGQVPELAPLTVVTHPPQQREEKAQEVMRAPRARCVDEDDEQRNTIIHKGRGLSIQVQESNP